MESPAEPQSNGVTGRTGVGNGGGTELEPGPVAEAEPGGDNLANMQTRSAGVPGVDGEGDEGVSTAAADSPSAEEPASASQ